MLRGPQTVGEIRTHSHRLFDFDDLDDVQYELGRLTDADPPLVVALPRQPGQKEGRYAHLLCGEPDIPEVSTSRPAPARSGLESRIDELEEQLAEVLERLGRLESD
jgi:uncharacterized protein YceH (UPF0502 family)